MVRFRKHSSHSSITPDTTTYSKNQKTQPSVTSASSYFVTNVIFISFALALTLLLSAFFYVEEEQHQHHETINKKQELNNPISSSLRNFKKQPQQQRTTINYVTVVLPSVVKPKGRLQRLESISSTWGPSSHALYVIHSASEFPNVTTTSYPQPLLLPPSITVDDGVPRLQHVIRSILTLHNNTSSPPIDYAFFVNDHTFVIPSHLLHYLTTNHPHGKISPTDPLYAGHALKNSHDPFMFNSGAAGYILSRRSMSDLVREWDDPTSKCQIKKLSNWLQGNPGLVSAKCLSEVLGAAPVDTREEGEGGHVFHAFGLVRTVGGKVDDWYVKKHERLDFMMEGLDDKESLLPSGVRCCSKRTVSFHYVEAKENVVLYEILGMVAGSKTRMTDDEIQNVMLSKWPSGWGELGGYSMGLPNVEDKTAWKDLVDVVRKISEGFYDYN